METFTITRDWIFDNRTPRGAWNKKQLQALGIKWPATSGWIDSIVDTTISSHNARTFEEAKGKAKAKNPNVLDADKAIAYLFKNVNRLTPQHIVKLRNVESKYLDNRKGSK